MPQLNPAPWLAVLLFSWLIFLTVLPPKVLAHLSPNNPSSTLTSEKPRTGSWTWPWY